MKKRFTYVTTNKFFVVTQRRTELKRVCHDIKIPCRDTTKERLKKECHDIAKIVATQADQVSPKDCSKLFRDNSLRDQQHKASKGCCDISKLCRNNYQIVSTKVGCDIQILHRDTKEGTRL